MRCILVANRSPRSHTTSLAATLERGLKGMSGDVVHHYVAGERTIASDVSRYTLNDGGCLLDEVPLSDVDWKQFYADWCNTVVYFLLLAPYVECLAPLGSNSALKRAWRRFVEVNRRFADATYNAINEFRARGPQLVWVHDPHPLMVGVFLRERAGAEGTTLPPLGWFLHHPWPPAQVIRDFKYGRQLVEAILAYDLVGFQSRRDLANFGETLDALGLGAEVNKKKAGVFPISVDRAYFNGISMRDPGIGKIPKPTDGVQVVMFVERVDPAKGVEAQLAGVEMLLERRSDFIEKVVILRVGEPSRKEVEAYQVFHQRVRKEIERINTRFRRGSWEPILVVHGLNREELAWLYHNRADVLGVTSLRDGQNLILQEAASTGQSAPMLAPILSREAGAVELIGEDGMALVVAPTPDEISRALERGLEMSALERRQRMARIRERVSQYTVHEWMGGFMAELAQRA